MWFGICYLHPAHPKSSITHSHYSRWIHVKRCAFSRKSIKRQLNHANLHWRQQLNLHVFTLSYTYPIQASELLWDRGSGWWFIWVAPSTVIRCTPRHWSPGKPWQRLQHEHYTARFHTHWLIRTYFFYSSLSQYENHIVQSNYSLSKLRTRETKHLTTNCKILIKNAARNYM